MFIIIIIIVITIIHVYVYVYVYVYVVIYSYIYIYIQLSIVIHSSLSICVCIYIYIYIYILLGRSVGRSVGRTVDDIAGRRLREEDLEWTRWQVEWPPFFRPSAAAMGPGGRELHVAEGSVLRTLECAPAAPVLCRVTRALVLPEAARGLSADGLGLLVVGDSGFFAVDRPGPNQSSAPVATDAWGILGLASAARQAACSATLVSRHGLGNVTAAAALPLPRGPVGPAVAVASETGALYVGLAGDAEGPDRLRVVARPGRLRALHVSAAGPVADEPVLWASGLGPGVTALGLTTGRELGAFAAPRGWREDAGAREASGAGAAAGRDGGAVSALAGNATHLLVITTVVGEPPAIFSAPLPTLRPPEAAG